MTVSVQHHNNSPYIQVYVVLLLYGKDKDIYKFTNLTNQRPVFEFPHYNINYITRLITTAYDVMVMFIYKDGRKSCIVNPLATGNT